MKKYFSVVLMALCSLTACAKEQVITFDQVPEPLDRGLLDVEYDVKFNDGRSLEFNKAGELTKVDCKQTEVPSALIPELVRQYVKANFPNAFITEWGKDDRRWKAELNSGLELEFNSNYEFVRIDD